ncbi:MAG: AAA family ATPase [Maribacter sp.]|nr:AAA family ATPase [Maribacter sp.]
MLGLTIDNIQIVAETNGGRFSTNIPLFKGLNVIRAENSSGKSTCVNAIAYGLGLEPILGPRSKRPFPKSLYEVIYDNKQEENPFFVSYSRVSITATNNMGKTAITTRDILGDENKVSIFQDGETHDYFLGSAGSVGSAKSERGFHHWLAEFIGWDLPNVVTFDGNEIKLYIECVFPLFFIEQKRGWSEIQANIPTSYGIKNVKKSAVEFCLGIDSFEHDKKVTRLKNSIDALEKDWEQLKNSAEGIADFNSVILNRIPDIKNYKDSYDIEFQYQGGDTTYSVSERRRTLKKQIEQLSKDISNATPDDENLSNQQAVLRRLRREAEKKSSETEIAMLSLTDVENKLSILKNELDRYQQLRRLKIVGSSISADLETKTCPICESELYDTLGNRTVKREPMTLEENIEFLKSQTDFYVNIKVRSVEALKTFQSQGKLLKARIHKEEEVLKELREDINDINGDTKALLRNQIQAEIDFREAEKLGASLNDLKGQSTRIYSSWKTANDSLKVFRKPSSNADKSLIIRELLTLIKGNLTAFNFTPSAIGAISISDQTLRPEQEGYDIVAETSASDYIRIIWSYTLALLQLAGKHSNVLHSGFIVFDEPRQHEASHLSFSNLIAKASEADTYNGQVIFATSLKKNELEEACKERNVNLHCFDNYILTLEPEPDEEDVSGDKLDNEERKPGSESNSF